MSDALARRLGGWIAAEGPISIARYMAACLTDPDHGYYTTGDPLGASGDFTTAPEISQTFGELIGLWAADSWAAMGGPERVLLAELGPGRGTLMRDALRAAKAVPPFAMALEPHLIEISPVLRAAQERLLDGTGARWHADPDSLPDAPVILIANEVFDALPIRQFQRAETGWRERLVDVDEDAGFRLVLARGPDPAEMLLRGPETPGTVAELCPAGWDLARRLGQRVRDRGGALLIVDYGYGEPTAGDTWQAVRGHRRVDPLSHPGDTDLTAHVDFARLARVLEECGLATHGPVPQGTWLTALGIGARLDRLLRSATPRQADSLRDGVDRLIAPGRMGTLFQVLAATPKGTAPPAGFEKDPR